MVIICLLNVFIRHYPRPPNFPLTPTFPPWAASKLSPAGEGPWAHINWWSKIRPQGWDFFMAPGGSQGLHILIRKGLSSSGIFRGNTNSEATHPHVNCPTSSAVFESEVVSSFLLFKATRLPRDYILYSSVLKSQESDVCNLRVFTSSRGHSSYRSHILKCLTVSEVILCPIESCVLIGPVSWWVPCPHGHRVFMWPVPSGLMCPLGYCVLLGPVSFGVLYLHGSYVLMGTVSSWFLSLNGSYVTMVLYPHEFYVLRGHVSSLVLHYHEFPFLLGPMFTCILRP